jgi:hypothetical protein
VHHVLQARFFSSTNGWQRDTKMVFFFVSSIAGLLAQPGNVGSAAAMIVR